MLAEELRLEHAAAEAAVPDDDGWRALVRAGVPVFVTSTFHADVVLVPLARRADAVAALAGAGHEVAA